MAPRRLASRPRAAMADLQAFEGVLGSEPQIDPALAALAAGNAPPIDPALFTIEQVVNDVRRGRITPEPQAEAVDAVLEQVAEQAEAHVPLDVADDVDHDSHIPLDDDGIDPALREIVNSLTKAQQSHTIDPPEDRERLERERLQSLQTTLEDFASTGFGSYNAIFNTSFPETTPQGRYMLPNLDEFRGSLTEPRSLRDLPQDNDSTPPVKRGRGRPKGSKNKPKPGAIIPTSPQPKRPRGRPPRPRTAEEIAEEERRKQDKELGIVRKRGRPRKFPEIGLVREMRLKKNRPVVQEKLRQLREREEQDRLRSEEVAQNDPPAESSVHDVEALGHEVAAAVGRPDQEYWPFQDGQTLLDVVGSMTAQREALEGEAAKLALQGDDAMNGVFGLDVQH